MAALAGYKTYIVLGISAITWFLEAIGIIPNGSLDGALPLLVLAGGATVTDKLNRMIG